MRRDAAALAGVATLAACGSATPGEPYTRLDELAPSIPGFASSQPALLSFWATWCPPCVEETPSLRALAADPPAGLAVILVSQDEDPAAIDRFFGGPPPRELRVVRDPGRGLAASLRVQTLPATFLVVEGRVVARFDGPRHWDRKPARATLERLVERSRQGR